MKAMLFPVMFLSASLGLASHGLAMEQAGADDKKKCTIPAGQAVSGDYKLPAWVPGDYVTFGPVASIQAARYDLALKKAA